MEYLRLPEPDLNTLETCMTAARSYIEGYTGMRDEELDEYPDVSIAFMALVQDMYDNRAYQPQNPGGVNRVVESILSMHARNLI